MMGELGRIFERVRKAGEAARAGVWNRGSKSWGPVLLAVSVFAALALQAGCSHETIEGEPPRPVKVAVVEARGAAASVHYASHIEAAERVAFAFKVGGYIEEITRRRGVDGKMRLLQGGDSVSKGTLLARVRESDYRARVEQARSALAQTTAALEKAQSDLGRAERLYAEKSLTKSDFDAAKASKDASEASAGAARAQLEGAEIELADCTLRAPMDALVLSRQIEASQLVAPGSVAFVLADVRTVKAVFGVPDTLVSRLRQGLSVDLVTESLLGHVFRGRITSISPMADPQSRVFEVEVTIPNEKGLLKVGEITTATLAREDEAAVQAAPASAGPPEPLAPLTAIVKSTKGAGGYAIFAFEGTGDEGIARERNVRLGTVYGNRIAIEEGVHAGERVIVTGATLVADGERVRIVP